MNKPFLAIFALAALALASEARAERRSPKGQVRITFAVERDSGDGTLELRVEALPLRECATLELRIRGIDGVSVQGDLSGNEPCVPGQAAVRRFTAHAPPGVRGFAVAEAALLSGSARVSGASASAIVAHPGARPPHDAAGRLQRGRDGGKVVILKGEAR